MKITWSQDGQAKAIAVDATISATPAFSSNVTERPVEIGANISDHVRVNAPRISLEAIVTNTPHAVPETHNRGASASTKPSLRFTPEMNRVGDVYAEIRDLVLGGTLVTVEISLQKFDNMILTNLSVPRSVDFGSSKIQGRDVENGMRFTFDAVHIRFVEAQTTAKQQRKTNKAKTSRGTQMMDKARPEEESALSNATGLGASR